MDIVANSRALASLILFLWLNSQGSKAASRTNFVYEKNGVRLVGGDATKGTLELLPRASAGVNSYWVQVCPDAFDDEKAQVLCANLGYTYGRQYYSPELSFPTNKTVFIGQIVSCGTVDVMTSTYGQYSQYGHRRRRHLRAAASDTHGGRSGGSASSDTERGTDGGGNSAASGLLLPAVKRRGLSLSWLLIDANSTAPYSCVFRNGQCNPKGPLVALQCSNVTFQPAPPPPPSPPNAPPPPPAVSNDIRLIGAKYENNVIMDSSVVGRGDGSLEPNLCATNSLMRGVCQSYARVEMLVDSPNPKAPGKIWAPVCNITDGDLAKTVAYVACSQRFQERRKPWLPDLWYINAHTSRTPLLIPTGKTFSTSDFNPTKVGGWVTISGAKFDDARLQDTKFKVSSSPPCAKGAMLAVSCNRVMNIGALGRRQQ